MDIYSQEYKKYIELKLHEHVEFEYDCLLREMTENIMNGKKRTEYRVSLTKGDCKIWDPSVCIYNIIKRLRSDNLKVYFRYPNKLIIIHKPKRHILGNKKMMKIQKFLRYENAKSINGNIINKSKRKTRLKKSNRGKNIKIL